MADLQTNYLGNTLDNPLVVSSSGITGSIDGIRKCADHGAGAVVLKSMFEEIIIVQSEKLERDLLRSKHPEAYDFLQAQIGMRMGSKPYLKFIEDVRTAVSIPVIASVNCTSSRWWIPYAREIENAGAHALELNIHHFPEPGDDPRDIEQRYADIVGEVTARISIPVAVKLGCLFTSMWRILRSIVDAGAQGLVLFNRFSAADMDLAGRRFSSSVTFSTPQEMNNPLRWIGLVSGEFACDFAASTGIHTGEDALKLLMAGADVIQVCSALYLHGVGVLSGMREHIDSWLDAEGYASVSEIRGIARTSTGYHDTLLKRLQYLSALNDAAEYKFE